MGLGSVELDPYLAGPAGLLTVREHVGDGAARVLRLFLARPLLPDVDALPR